MPRRAVSTDILAVAKARGLKVTAKAGRPAKTKQWKGPVLHKYGAVKTVTDGIRFDSKAEADYYEYQKRRRARGEVIFFLRQTTIHLPGGVRMVLDFLIFEADGRVRFVDVKGMPTRDWLNKAKMAQSLYAPMKIETAKKTRRGDFIEKEVGA